MIAYMEKFFKNKKSAIVLSLFAMALWGSAIPLIKTTYRVMDVAPNDFGLKILIAGARFFMAGLLALFYYKITKSKTDGASRINLKFVLILSLIQTSLQYFFYYIGLSNTFGVKASVIQAFGSFLTVIMAALFIPTDKLDRYKVIAIIVGTLGIVVSNRSGIEGTGFKITGEGFILMSTLFNALATVLVRIYGKDQNSFLLTGLQFLFGAVVLIVAGLILKKGEFYLTPTVFILLLYGAFISATAFSIWTFVLKFQDAGEFALYKLFIPILGSVFSIIFLGESFTIHLVISLTLVIIGTVILNMKRKKAN